MNVKVVIELDGPAHEVERWLARLGLPPSSAAPLQHPVGRVDGWTPELMERLVGRITDRARDVLRLMAEGAPEVSFDDIQEHLDVGGVQLGGILASFGFAERAGFPRPYEVDRDSRRYLMDQDVAQLALEALDDYEAED